MDSFDSPPENALEWAEERLRSCDWAIIITGDSESWERGIFGIENLNQFLGIMEDVKLTEWMMKDQEEN